MENLKGTVTDYKDSFGADILYGDLLDASYVEDTWERIWFQIQVGDKDWEEELKETFEENKPLVLNRSNYARLMGIAEDQIKTTI